MLHKMKFDSYFISRKSIYQIKDSHSLYKKQKRPRNARPLVFYLSEEISREVLRRISLRLKLR